MMFQILVEQFPEAGEEQFRQSFGVGNPEELVEALTVEAGVYVEVCQPRRYLFRESLDPQLKRARLQRICNSLAPIGGA